jgi:high-affinity Fe2+/Pb2+ permease
MPTLKNDKKIAREKVERTIYLILIVGLTVWGLWHSEAATALINAVKEAFSLLLNTTM